MAKTVVAWILIALGLFMLAGFLASEKESRLIADIVMLLLFVAAPIMGGISLLYKRKKAREQAAVESKKLIYAAREKEILKLAAENKGLLSIGQIVRETSLTSNDAEEVLHELIVKGVVGLRTSADGQVVYEFPEYADVKEFERHKMDDELLRE